ncbi:SurA N-terminal domain-containing protein, partial [Gammaproteobacteria bacterium]|nr:SurA N-terminal domain-containing protein [Gammaproteobacteria bacterium]
MLESLRSFLSGKTLLIFVTIMAIPFVFFGSSAVGTIFTTYGKVNGLEVTQSDYNAANNAVNQRMVQAYGEDFSPDQFPDDVLLQMVKEEIITQKTLLSETQDLGIFVSDADAKKDIMMSPNFQTDSQFDQIAFETSIRTQGYTPNDYIAMVQEGKAKNFLIDALTSSFFTLDSEIVNIAKLIEQERDVSFTKIDFNLLKNGVTADLTEAQSFYDSNSLQFYSDESRSMNYILLDNSKYRSLVEVPQNYVQEAYSDYLQRLNMRSEKRASHIMVDLMNYSSKAEANKTIELAQNKLNEGDSFNEVVLAFSEDLISKEEEGDIGYSAGDVFPDEFEKALSDMSIGDISEILFSEATNSFHILKLTEINKEDAKSFDEMKDVLLEELVSAESMALMDEDRDVIDNAILDNQSIEDIALLLDLEILSSNETTLFDFDFEIKDQRISQALFGFPEGL